MTREAWVMMLCVWSVVICIAGYFLLRVLTLPQRTDDSADSED